MRTPAPHFIWAAVTSAILLPGCGGGGSSPQAARPATETIAGHAIKGAVSGATVTAYAIEGGAMGSPLGQAMTGTDGSYSLAIPATAGPVMLRMTGGAYVDEATGSTVTMPSGQVMTVVMASPFAGSGEVEITPLTSMAQMMAAGMPGGMSAANIGASNSAVGAYFMVTDILHTMPMNALAVGSGATATTGSLNYGMTLAAMSQYAKDAGIPSSAMVAAMMADASDGVLDGKSGTAPIAMGGMMGGGMMPAGAGGPGLAAAMLEFMNSASNRSGATAAMMSGLMQQLGAAGGVMH